MALELVYTSATRGLRAGTSGFCTVAMTRALPAALVPRLEALGGYRPGPGGDGPVARSFWRIETASGVAHVLSAVGPAPPDHTQRTNKIATYLVLGPDELADAGPAWMLSQADALRSAWSGGPAWIEEPARAPRGGPVPMRICSAWAEACGDAGWAGVLASAFLRDQGKPVHVIYPAEVDALALIDDAMHLLPSWARWRATFTTYFLQPVAGTLCAWRFCLDGTPGADSARQSKGLVIDLARPLGQAADSRFVRMARTGVDPDIEADAARAAKERASRERAAARAATEIELQPPVERPMAGAPTQRAVVARGFTLPADDEPLAPSLPRPQILVAIIAAIVTLVALGIVIAVTMSRDAGAPQGGTPATEPAPAPAPAPTPDVPATATPGPPAQPPAPPAIPAEAATPPAGAPATASTPAQTPEEVPTEKPAARPVDTPADTPADSPADKPSNPREPLYAPTEPAPMPTPEPASRFGRIDPTHNPNAPATSIRASAPASAAVVRAEFTVPAFLQSAGVVADGGSLAFSWQGMRASLKVEAGSVRVDGDAPGTPPEALQACFPGTPLGDGPVALREIISRVLIELFNDAGTRVAVAQLRAPVTSALSSGTPMIARGVPDPEVVVQLLRKGTAEPLESALVARGGSQELDVATMTKMQVTRDARTSELRITVDGPTEREVGIERSRLANLASSADRLQLVCTMLKNGMAKKSAPPGLNDLLKELDEALNAKERAMLTDAKGKVRTLNDAEVLNKILPSVSQRMADQASDARMALGELSDTPSRGGAAAKRPELSVRIMGTDGFVFVDAPLRLLRLREGGK